MDSFDDEPTDETARYSVLGIRIADEQRNKIKEAAKLEDRTESSFARFHLTRAAESVIAANQPQTSEP